MASKSKVHDSTPLLVGVGRYTFQRKGRPKDRQRFGVSPLEMMLEATRRAIVDAGLDPNGIELDSIATISAATDAIVIAAASNGKNMKDLGDDRMLYANPPGTLAAALGCPVASVRELVTTGDSGNMPQNLVNRAFEKIAQGKLQSAIILGAEALHSFNEAQKQGVTAAEMKARWSDAGELNGEAAGRLAELHKSVGLSIYPEGMTRDEAGIFYTEHGRKHGIGAPSTVYPLIENAIRAESGRSLQDQQVRAAEIFAGFSDVAQEEKQHAWFGTAYSPAELFTPTEDNRPIVHPFYLKRLNSVMAVDMSAAVLVMSAAEARRRGVPEEKWVFLHGCGQGNDTLELLERPSLCASPAIRIACGRALRAAGIQDVNRDLQHLDIYSCFPSAVQVACKELGISDARKPLTVTGGLPYHGGPGSNYVTHSIAAMAEKLRAHPASERARGLVTANGGYLTKHSFGVYANFPDEAALRGTWHREDPAIAQAEIDALPREKVAMLPEGTGVVESYAVRYGRKGPEMTVIIGKLIDGPSKGHRFVANTSKDTASLRQFVDGDPIGAKGVVSTSQGKAVFRLQAPDSKL